MAWSPTADQIASVDDGGTVRIWHPVAGGMAAALSRRATGVTDIAWSPRGDCLATGWADGAVTVHHPDTLAEVGRLHVGSVTAIGWHERGLAVAARDRPVSVLELITTGQPDARS